MTCKKSTKKEPNLANSALSLFPHAHIEGQTVAISLSTKQLYGVFVHPAVERLRGICLVLCNPQCCIGFPRSSVHPCVFSKMILLLVWVDFVIVGGWYIARVQYSSLGESAAFVSLGAVDMEEGVRIRVQVECGREEVNNGEKQEKDKHEETDNERTIKRSSRMTRRWNDARMQTPEPCSEYAHNQTRAMCMRKMTCELFLFTHPVGYSGSLSTVNETNCNKKNSDQSKILMSSFPIPSRLVPPRCA